MEAPNLKEPVPVADMLPNYKSRLSQQNLAELSKPIEIHNEENQSYSNRQTLRIQYACTFGLCD